MLRDLNILLDKVLQLLISNVHLESFLGNIVALITAVFPEQRNQFHKPANLKTL